MKSNTALLAKMGPHGFNQDAASPQSCNGLGPHAGRSRNLVHTKCIDAYEKIAFRDDACRIPMKIEFCDDDVFI